ncbi:hypothetical protein VTK56DRAFT_716 [Thermocarpiscus australiensis]
MDGLVNLASAAGNRFATNLKTTLADMTPEKWIRLVIIVGTYLLLRPYLIKLGGRAQMKAHEQEAAQSEAAAKAKISPNELRGRVNIPDDTDDEDDAVAGQSSGPDWGKKARRRQRQMIKQLLEAQERKLMESREEEEDKDIEEFLVKE